MAETPTTGELYKAKTVTVDEIVAAVDVFIRDPTVGMCRFASGHSFDPAAAVKAPPWAKATVTHADAIDFLKQAAVRTAILLARPGKK